MIRIHHKCSLYCEIALLVHKDTYNKANLPKTFAKPFITNLAKILFFIAKYFISSDNRSRSIYGGPFVQK